MPTSARSWLGCRSTSTTCGIETYDQLQADVSEYGVTGSFGVHASTLVQTYEAFLSGKDLLADPVWFSRASVTPSMTEADRGRRRLRRRDEPIRGHEPADRQAAWDAMRGRAGESRFAATIKQALDVALRAILPFAGDLAGAGVALASGIGYVGDLSDFVVALQVCTTQRCCRRQSHPPVRGGAHGRRRTGRGRPCRSCRGGPGADRPLEAGWPTPPSRSTTATSTSNVYPNPARGRSPPPRRHSTTWP